MAPSKQISAKRSSGVISALFRRINTGCLGCTLKASTKNIFEKLGLRGKSIYTLINNSGYERRRTGNSFMQSLTLKHLQ